MTRPQADAIESVCIVGCGPIAQLTALAFARKLPQADVRLVRLAGAPAGPCDIVGGALPSLRLFHAYLGIDDRELVARGIATHRLATRFTNWSRSGEPWHYAHGDVGQPADTVPFHQIWTAEHRLQPDLPPFDSFSAAAMLARHNRFPAARAPLLPGFVDFALRIDMLRYAGWLDTLLSRSAVQDWTGEVADVILTDVHHIEAVMLGSGERVTADLFIDCSGPSAVLMNAIEPAWDSWAGWCPFNYLTVTRATLSAANVCDRVTATLDGWEMVISQGDHQLEVIATDSPQPGSVEIAPGSRPRPWLGNVVAIGDAAAVIPPILPVAHSLAGNAIERILAHLPGRNNHAAARAEYNRRNAQEMLRVRDLIIALHVGGVPAVPIWPHHPIKADLPESLALTFDQFQYRGRLPFFEEEQVDQHGWLCILLGMGSIPNYPDPSSTAVSAEAARAGMKRLSDSLAAFAEAMPAYPNWLA